MRSLPPTADPAGRRGAACANQQVPIRAAPVSDTEPGESGWLPREEARLAGRGGACHPIWTRGGTVQYPGVSRGVSLGQGVSWSVRDLGGFSGIRGGGSESGGLSGVGFTNLEGLSSC